jgi:hypothetical protein
MVRAGATRAQARGVTDLAIGSSDWLGFVPFANDAFSVPSPCALRTIVANTALCALDFNPRLSVYPRLSFTLPFAMIVRFSHACEFIAVRFRLRIASSIISDRFISHRASQKNVLVTELDSATTAARRRTPRA